MKLNLFLCCVAVLASTMISSAQGNNNPSFTRGFAGNVEAESFSKTVLPENM